MRDISAVLLMLASSVCAAGADQAPTLEAAFASAQGRLSRVAMRAVGACFERADDERADALGLPKRFCIDRVGTRLPADAVTPFDDGGSALVEGAPSAGAMHISGGARRRDGGWDIVADLFHSEDRGFGCGRLNYSFAAAYFPVSADGRPLDGPVEVRGFMVDGSPSCREEAKAVQLDYRRL